MDGDDVSEQESASGEVDESQDDGEEAAARASFLWYFLPFFSMVFFYAAPGFLFWHLERQTVLQILMALFLLAVVNGLTALYHGWRRNGTFLERAAMMMKYGLIPFYFALFIAAMVSGDFDMGRTHFWGRTFAVSTWDVLSAAFALALLSGTGYVLAAIETAVGEDRLHPFLAVLHGVVQFIPIADILDLIWLVAVREGRARILSLFALLLLLAALAAAGAVALRFLG